MNAKILAVAAVAIMIAAFVAAFGLIVFGQNLKSLCDEGLTININVNSNSSSVTTTTTPVAAPKKTTTEDIGDILKKHWGDLEKKGVPYYDYGYGDSVPGQDGGYNYKELPPKTQPPVPMLPPSEQKQQPPTVPAPPQSTPSPYSRAGKTSRIAKPVIREEDYNGEGGDSHPSIMVFPPGTKSMAPVATSKEPWL